MELRIGISGWSYANWRKRFYPPGLSQRRELEFASRQFNSIEINGSFYSLQRPESYCAWREAVPGGFVFAVKGGRYITHMKKLRDVDEPLANFFASGVLRLEEKLGPILWQFPPSLGFERERFERFLDLLPRDTASASRLARRHSAWMRARASASAGPMRTLRHAFEVRHASLVAPEFLELLSRHGVALVIADTAGRWPYSEALTARDFVYVRLHGATELYASGYDEREIGVWAERVRAWNEKRDVYVYFDNDARVRAPFDALALAERIVAKSPARAA